MSCFTGKRVVNETVYKQTAYLLALRHKKKQAVYRCPHCGQLHLSTKHTDGADSLFVADPKKTYEDQHGTRCP